jgi:hypothetical protein
MSGRGWLRARVCRDVEIWAEKLGREKLKFKKGVRK